MFCQVVPFSALSLSSDRQSLGVGSRLHHFGGLLGMLACSSPVRGLGCIKCSLVVRSSGPSSNVNQSLPSRCYSAEFK